MLAAKWLCHRIGQGRGTAKQQRSKTPNRVQAYIFRLARSLAAMLSALETKVKTQKTENATLQICCKEIISTGATKYFKVRYACSVQPRVVSYSFESFRVVAVKVGETVRKRDVHFLRLIFKALNEKCDG